MEQLVLDLSRPPAPTLENFAPGSNSEALAVLRAWLAGTLQERCIYLCGPSGSARATCCARSAWLAGCRPQVAHVQTGDLETLERATAAIGNRPDDVHHLPAGGRRPCFACFSDCARTRRTCSPPGICRLAPRAAR
jgi:hypothetical protein